MNLNDEMNNMKKEYRQILVDTVDEMKNCESFEKFYENLCLKQAQIKEKRKKYKCSQCASCCKLAISEFSFEELKNKAKFGDSFASQFISVFVPYENIDEAKNNYPEYFEFLKHNSNEQAYFYHCPKVTKDNKCSDYENRPQICKDFPDNPVAFFHPLCSFKDWKKESEKPALEIKAVSDILGYYKTQS